jgi:hypothetical protein
MGFFSNLFSRKKKKEKDEKKKEQIDWDSLNYGKPAQPSNLTPIDLDPWKT